jgi:hypothetical protein
MRVPAQSPVELNRPYIVHSSTRRKWRRWPLIAAIIVAVILAAIVVLFARHWPFTRTTITRDLEQATGAKVEIRNLRQTYFPPGAVADRLVFRRDQQSPPLITLQRLTIRASYPGMLRHHVALLKAEGMHVALPLGELSRGSNSASSKTVIDELQADGAVLDFIHANGPNRATRFQIHQFRIHDLGTRGAMAFQVALATPKPLGEVRANGRIGPWNSANPKQTSISGSYSFRHADLATFKAVGGVLSSDGKFQGPVSALQVDGSTDMPDFEVANVAHRERLSTKFHAVVNATNGDVSLPTVNAELGDTPVFATGKIASLLQHQGKTVAADFLVHDGRIQDVLWLFMKSPRPPLAGVTSFKAHAVLPPGHERFLRKLRFVADFGIDDARLTKPSTEQKVSQLSERARGNATPPPDPADVLSDLKGHVDVRDGIAHLSNLSFAVPGAVAHMHGTYDLITKKINLHGTVQTQVKLSQTTSGAKSFLMKVVGKFSNKNRPGVPIPVSVVGTYPNPTYKIDPI